MRSVKLHRQIFLTGLHTAVIVPHLSEKGYIRITAKDGRGEIMLVQNEGIEGDISAEEIKLFQIFAQRLDEELTINLIDEQQAN
ncbi:hypothetical protein NDA07_27760 [Microcoleus vaginatus DQ-U2]|uniref:hypothetical protein n=1 Tax=Microcoleus vaginatus TaxID=119532 RepID=UPI00168415C5|nr:hypothetical protein [Microcoleus sp. FACHB-DQ6]